VRWCTPATCASRCSTPPPDINVAAATGSAQFGPEISERVLWLVRDGLHEARLQLNPRELGPVEVRLSGGQPAWERSRGGDIEDSLPAPAARVVGHGLVDACA
jgi:flagellar hook-length control protein FliK